MPTIPPAKKQYAAYLLNPPNYRSTMQYSKYDTSAPVGKEEQRHLQPVKGKFLLYARAFDGMLLAVLSALTVQQAKSTQETIKQVQQCMQSSQNMKYCWRDGALTATNPNVDRQLCSQKIH